MWISTKIEHDDNDCSAITGKTVDCHNDNLQYHAVNTDFKVIICIQWVKISYFLVRYRRVTVSTATIICLNIEWSVMPVKYGMNYNDIWIIIQHILLNDHLFVVVSVCYPIYFHSAAVVYANCWTRSTMFCRMTRSPVRVKPLNQQWTLSSSAWTNIIDYMNWSEVYSANWNRVYLQRSVMREQPK